MINWRDLVNSPVSFYTNFYSTTFNPFKHHRAAVDKDGLAVLAQRSIAHGMHDPAWRAR